MGVGVLLKEDIVVELLLLFLLFLLALSLAFLPFALSALPLNFFLALPLQLFFSPLPALFLGLLGAQLIV